MAAYGVKDRRQVTRMEEEFSILPRQGALSQDSFFICNAYIFHISFQTPQVAIKGMDRFRRSFLWRGKDPDQVRVTTA
jgi:hypothetical protein